jgi:dTDP-glucose pyrophosphorylase
MKILIPMAGIGQRFKDAGYKEIKPLITVIDKPMILSVIENLGIENEYIIVTNRDIGNSIRSILEENLPNFILQFVDHYTDGPACTALLAEEHISKEEDLIIVNCDQIIKDFSIDELKKFSYVNNVDGILGAFISTNKKNSYMKLDPNGEVIDVKEKIVISNLATNGLHYWKKGKYFIKSAKEMIEANERYNNEFYVAPTYNYLIKEGKKVLPFFYNLHVPIGTPEDLKIYEGIYASL